MSLSLDILLGVLDLEQIEHNIFRGQNRDIGSGRVFGGQVLAQSLVAAGRTVEGDRRAHSMHGYFILAGNIDAPIVYEVDRIRDGRSFTTRRVVAIQHGRAIFNMSASFHKQEAGREHQLEMPDVPPPEELPRELDLIRAVADRIPEEILREDQVLVLQVPNPEPLRPVQPNMSIARRMHGDADYGRMWLQLYEQIVRSGRVMQGASYPSLVNGRHVMTPSPIPRSLSARATP